MEDDVLLLLIIPDFQNGRRCLILLIIPDFSEWKTMFDSFDNTRFFRMEDDVLLLLKNTGADGPVRPV